MRLTTKGRFAVTAMLDLALNEANAAGQNRPVTLAGISERQHISLSYLEQLFSRLRKQGLVTVSYTHLDVYKRQPQLQWQWHVSFNGQFKR